MLRRREADLFKNAKKLFVSLVTKFYLPGCSSLKEKRIILNNVKDRFRRRFGIAFCETDFQNKWQRIGFLIVAGVKNIKGLDKILRFSTSFFDRGYRIICTDSEIDYL